MARKTTSKKRKAPPKTAKRAISSKKKAVSAPIQFCIDFALFPNGTVLGPSFALSGFLFAQNPGGGNDLTVTSTLGEKGLQFPAAGMHVTLPTPVAALSMRVGNFAGPFQVQALDSAGAVVASQVANFPNTYGDIAIQVTDPKIASLNFTNGNGEGVLVKLCITVKLVG